MMVSLFCALLSISALTWIAMLCTGQHIQIIEDPSNLLLPVNEIGTFSCKAQCNCSCSAFWYINDSVNFESGESQMNQRFIRGNRSVAYYTLILTVNASKEINNTRITCVYEVQGVGSDHNAIIVPSTTSAVLLVVSEPPLSSNPSLIRNATHHTVLWSPPFLWPGHRIDYYNISVVTSYKLDGNNETEYYRINGSKAYHCKIVSFTLNVGKACQSRLSCINVMFTISAFAKHSQPLKIFSVSDWTWTLPSEPVFTLPAFNISVLFKADRSSDSASIEVYIQLQKLKCHYHELNQTLLIENEEGNLVVEKEISPPLDSDVKTTIVLEMKRNHIYSLQLRVEAYSRSITTNKHYFYTYQRNKGTSCETCTTSQTWTSEVDNAGTLPYKVAMSVFIATTVLLLSSLILLLVCWCICHKREIRKEVKVTESKVRACNVMVHNPIYDGDLPLYESVHNQQYQSKDTVMQYDNIQRAAGSSTLQENSIPDGNCNVNQNCTPSVTVKSLKKDGQERNKLHLKLSIHGNESSPTLSKGIRNSSPKSGDLEM